MGVDNIEEIQKEAPKSLNLLTTYVIISWLGR